MTSSAETLRNAAPAAPAPGLPIPARLYVAAVLAAAAAAGAWALGTASPIDLSTVAIWTLACLVGQLFSFESPDRRILVSLTTLFHLAMLFHVRTAELLPAVWLSRITVDFFVKRHPWFKVLFNTAQSSLAALAALLVFRLFHDPAAGTPDAAALLAVTPGFLLAAFVYYTTNVLLVSGVLRTASGAPFREVLRANIGARREISSKGAMILLAPLAAFAFQVLGAWGLALFLIPMALLRDLANQYAALREAQPELARSEHSAGRGEMAVEVGHEINKYLTQIYGQLQLVMIRGDRSSPEEIRKRVALALTELANISSLSRGLIDFSRREKVLIPTEVNKLVKSTVSSLSLQNRLEGVATVLDLDPAVGESLVDPLQIQQCLRNLLLNAVEAVQESSTGVREITVRTRLETEGEEPTLEITVEDSGPGLPDVTDARLFEPGFTTREGQRGMGLCTALQIARSHRGGLSSIRSAGNEGASFLLSIPFSRP